MKRYILTGTAGAGKTSILQRLTALGYAAIEKAATDVIAHEQTQGVAKPWEHASFIDAIITMQKQRQVQAATTAAAIQLFDRSPICTYALSVYLGRPISPVLAAEIDRITREHIYEPQVFFIRNLGFVEPTAARRISFEDSLEFERIHEESYRAFGYSLIDIPAGELNERVAAITRVISRLTPRKQRGQHESGWHWSN
ncbi:MAG: AAA family ATPase [Longispora sp.]|nr:AAA family ATPase [Longispora sp. (in: high G+C Gram-positive bacteria)]